MEKMNVEEREMLFYYNSDDPFEREALGYMLTLEKVKLKYYDLQKERPTPRQIKEVADRMNLQPADLLLEPNPGLSEDDTLTLLHQDASAWKSPIIIEKDSAYFVKSPLNLIKKDLEIK